MKKSNSLRPAYYFAVAIVILVTIFQGCYPSEGLVYTSRDAYLRGHDPYQMYVRGEFFSPYYFGGSIITPGTFGQGGITLFNDNSQEILRTVFSNETGSRIALNLYYETSHGLQPVAIKNGEVWNRIKLKAGEQSYFDLLPGTIVYEMYEYIGPGEDDFSAKPIMVEKVKIERAYNFVSRGFHQWLNIYKNRYKM